jgi:PAS domain S-box-containing protein
MTEISAKQQASRNNLPFLTGGGEMGALLRGIDWSATALGQPETWPAALKQSISLMFSINFPVLICWGSDYIQFYNDAFRPINGESKHPQALGGSARGTYAEIWDTIGPMFEKVMGGETIGFPNFMVPLHRNGYSEDCYFDFSYSPIKDEHGHIGGILVICVETTEKVLAMRNFESLGEEMAATNEELAASNEEFAATNEELAAVNEELATTVDELAEAQTQLKTALEDTARSEKLFRSIVLNIPNSLIIVIDHEHRYVTIEGDIMERMGFDRKDYEGKHPTEVGPPERYEATRHLYDRVLNGEKFSVERKAETGEDYMVHFVPLKNKREEVEAGLIIAIDISEIKQAEEKSAKLAAIIDSSDDAIVSKTLESVITSWNDSAERIFGYTADEIIGETIYKIIPPDRYSEEPAILSRLKKGERVEHFETKRLRKDGSLLDISVTVSPVKDKSGNIIGLSKIARDITERKLDESRKNDFIGMASHELKTPLTSLSALLQVVGAKLKNSPDSFLAGAMEKANIQVKRMTNMVNGFLNVSRLEAGKIQIDKQPFDLDELLQEVTEEARIVSKGHQIVLDSCGAVTLNADRDKIGSVLSNLVSNAVKYSPRGKLVRLACSVTDNKVTVGIADEGMGIKAKDLPQIFDRYHRVESEHTRHISGFGIGLYLSAEIIKRHDGEIWAESEIGVGSTFYFSLPL